MRLTPLLRAKSLAGKLTLCLLLAPIVCVAEQASSNALPALTVTLTQVQRAEFSSKLSANGNIAAWQEVIIGSELNGLRLSDVLVNVGDVVKKGQLLADFSAETIEAELAQAKGSLAEAEALAKEAENNAARSRTLLDTGALS
ncbi:MAG: efflux RND transporter periplasmic adaptor subunit, partial [Pseudomonadota bacterium]